MNLCIAPLSPPPLRPDMSRDEAEAFVVEALALAMARDASSGGVIRTVTLDHTGATER